MRNRVASSGTFLPASYWERELAVIRASRASSAWFMSRDSLRMASFLPRPLARSDASSPLISPPFQVSSLTSFVQSELFLQERGVLQYLGGARGLAGVPADSLRGMNVSSP